jgi:hypothetical protein
MRSKKSTFRLLGIGYSLLALVIALVMVSLLSAAGNPAVAAINPQTPTEAVPVAIQAINNSGAVAITPSANLASASAEPAMVNTGFLNLREGPGVSYNVMLKLTQGQTVAILSRSGNWAFVQLPTGMRGWVNVRYLKKEAAPHGPSVVGACRTGDVLANVHNPLRLTVVNSCISAAGTVTEISHNPDGDLTFRLALDPSYAHLLNSGNEDRLRGYLQVEIIPADQPRVAAPELGEHVIVTGAYVLDTSYGWMEIHPAWYVKVESAELNPTPVTAPPR